MRIDIWPAPQRIRIDRIRIDWEAALPRGSAWKPCTAFGGVPSIYAFSLLAMFRLAIFIEGAARGNPLVQPRRASG